MSKVIDIVPRLKTVAVNQNFVQQEIVESAPVVDFNEKKNVLLFQERRQVKRTILTEFVSAMVVLPEKGLLKVTLYDISEDGLSFELEGSEGQFQPGEEIALRLYLNQKTYFPVQVVVKHVTQDSAENTVRHGVEYIKTAGSDVALQHFVRFIESIGTDLKSDQGDLMITKAP